PPAWLPRQQSPDYGIDYLVEISDPRSTSVTLSTEFHNSEPSGITFAVQLKGSSKLNYRANTIAFSIKSNHLEYYVDKYRFAVFLVVMDVAKIAGYWLFVQKYILEELSSSWLSQLTATVHIPLTQNLLDSFALRTAAVEAEKYMVGLRPASAPHAI